MSARFGGEVPVRPAHTGGLCKRDLGVIQVRTDDVQGVALVGAGPGDPGLLTLAALRKLAEAEVVLYDRLVSAEILMLANPAAELIYTGKEEVQQEAVQREIESLLLRHARAGRKVVRLKGGDPFVFGRGAEEALFLRSHGIGVELIPGVSSAIAAPGLAAVPLTCRGVSASFTVVTGRCREGAAIDWSRYAAVETLIVLMGVTNRREIAIDLIASGRSAEEPVAFIENGSLPEQRVLEARLSDVASGAVEVRSPAVWGIGEVVRMRQEIAVVGAAAGMVGADE